MNDKNNTHEVADCKTNPKIMISSKQGADTPLIQQIKDNERIRQTAQKPTNKE